MNFYKHYIGDFQRDTGHLSLTERGAYLALIHHYYATEKPLPKDHASLCRIAGAVTKSEQQAVKSVMGFFTPMESGLVHNRIEAELEKSGKQADTNRRIAIEREARRKAQREQDEQSTNRATNRDTKGSTNDQPNQTPDTNKEKTLSDKSDHAPPSDAVLVLNHLNLKTRRNYRPVAANIDLIAARLRDGVGVDECKSVIDAKVKQWGEDEKMREYLRPGTLFNRTKFEQYLGQVESGAECESVFEGAI